MSLYVRHEDKTDFYNDFMTRPDSLCSKEQKKMKFFMAMGTGDYENIPKSSHKLWGEDFKNLKESDIVEFDKHTFDKVKPNSYVQARSSKEGYGIGQGKA